MYSKEGNPFNLFEIGGVELSMQFLKDLMKCFGKRFTSNLSLLSVDGSAPKTEQAAIFILFTLETNVDHFVSPQSSIVVHYSRYRVLLCESVYKNSITS